MDKYPPVSTDKGETVYESGQFNIQDAQKEILVEARNYTHEREKSDFEILTELQTLRQSNQPDRLYHRLSHSSLLCLRTVPMTKMVGLSCWKKPKR